MRTQRLMVYVCAACPISLLAGLGMADAERGPFNAFLKGTYQLSTNATCSTGTLGVGNEK